MKNLAFLILALVGISQAQITYEGGRTQLADTVRWGDADDSSSSTLARGNANFRDSSGSWVAITTDSCSLPVRLSYGTVMPNSKLELSYEVRTSSGNTDSSQVKWRIDGRYCKGTNCESWVPAGRFRGDTSSIIMDSLISVATGSGTTWQPTRQIFDVPGGMQLRLCQDGYAAGGGTNDSTFFRRLVVRNSAIPAGGTPPSSATLTGDIEVSDVVITSSALPTGAATEATLAAASAKLPATLGQKAMAASMAVALASDQSAIPASQSGTWTVQPGNTANTTAWKVDGSAVTQPVSAAALPLPSGAATAANQSTEIASLATIAALSKAEDAPHTSTDPGVQALAVRRDANTTLATSDGDYGPLQLNADGSLKVAITAGAGSGGTSIADDAAFTPGSTSATPIAAFADETSPDQVDEGDAGAVRMTLYRGLHVNLRDASGAEVSVGGGTQYDDDAAYGGDGSKVTMAGVVRRDANTTLAGADGDVAPLQVNAGGQLKTEVVAMPNVTVGTFPDNEPFNVAQINGVTPLMGAGNTGTGSPRVTIATDQAAFSVNATATGAAAHDAAASGGPVQTGGVAQTSDPTAVTAGDATYSLHTIGAKQVVMPYSISGSRWFYAAASGGITNTTAVTIKAAAGAGIKNCIVYCRVQNGHASVDTEVIFNDGAAGTLLDRGWAQSGGGGYNWHPPVPVCGTANTLLEVDVITTGSAIYANCVGYTSAE